MAQKRVVVKTAGKLDDLLPCNILFICSSENNRISDHLSAIGSAHVVTVGEGDGFTDLGGMINFLISDENTVRFEINKSKTDLSGIKISSKLLQLAVRRQE